MKAVMRYVLAVLCLFTSIAHALDQTETGFFYPIGSASYNPACGTWLGRDTQHGGCYFNGYYHTGVDMMHGLEGDVYAIADGKVVYISYDKPGDGDGKKWGVGNCALVVEHRTTESRVFTAVYGHLRCSSLPAKYAEVEAGVPIGKIGYWDHGNHLHFAVHDGAFSGSNPMARSGWGMMANSEWTNPCEGNNACTNTFTDPVAFIQTHFAYNPSTEKQVACQGHVCWSPKTVACEAGTM